MDAHYNGFQKTFLAKNHCDCNQIRWNQIDIKTTNIFCLSKTHQKKHVGVVSIFHPSKLHQKIASKWRGILARFAKKVLRYNVELTPVDITSIKARQNDVEFCLSKSDRKSSLERRVVSFGTQLVIVFPVIIRLELFESQRDQNLVKPTLKSSKKGYQSISNTWYRWEITHQSFKQGRR